MLMAAFEALRLRAAHTAQRVCLPVARPAGHTGNWKMAGGEWCDALPLPVSVLAVSLAAKGLIISGAEQAGAWAPPDS